MTDVFVKSGEKDYNGLPRKILIRGEAGSGKSTFSKKLVHEWTKLDADNVGNITHLSTFDLVFYIDCALLNEPECLAKQSLDDAILFNMIYQYIRQQLLLKYPIAVIREICNKYKILFVIDGFEELRLGQDLINKFSGNSDYDFTIVLTSRTVDGLQYRKYNKILTLVPWSTEQLDIFFATQSSIDNRGGSIANKYNLPSMLGTPLMAWFYYFLQLHNFKDLSKRTQTILYVNIIDDIKRLTARKLGNTDSERETYLNDINHTVNELQRRAYQCVCRNENYFMQLGNDESENKFLDFSLKVGLVCLMKDRSGTTEQKKYQFIHRSIMEFLAAKYLSISGSVVIDEKLDAIRDIEKHEQLLIFLCGLDREKEHITTLFKKYIPKVVNSFDERSHFALQCFAEIEMESETVDHLWWDGHVDGCLTLRNLECLPYCSLGINRLIITSALRYNLKKLTMEYYAEPDSTHMLGSVEILKEIIEKAQKNYLLIDGNHNMEAWLHIGKCYEESILHKITLNKLVSYYSSSILPCHYLCQSFIYNSVDMP